MNKSELKQLIKEEISKVNLKENLNPEVTKSVDRFIKAMAQRYGYEEKDAIHAIQTAILYLRFKRNSELDGELYTPNEMADKAVEDESNGPGY